MNLETVVPVEPVLDELFVRINLVQNNICVGLMAGSESYDFKCFGHFFKEADGVRPDCDVGIGILAVF